MIIVLSSLRHLFYFKIKYRIEYKKVLVTACSYGQYSFIKLLFQLYVKRSLKDTALFWVSWCFLNNFIISYKLLWFYLPVSSTDCMVYNSNRYFLFIFTSLNIKTYESTLSTEHYSMYVRWKRTCMQHAASLAWLLGSQS